MRNDKKNKTREQIDRLEYPSVDMLDHEIVRQNRKESYRRLTRGVLIGLIAVAAAIILISDIWLPIIQIDGSSMNPLLKMNEIVLVAKTERPEKSDVIAFYQGNKLLVKRVIGMEGDRIDIDGNGAVSVNGQKLNEPYVTKLSLGDCDINFPYTVPPGTVFVLGDNRPVALDSRSSTIGPVSRDQIVGTVKFRVWPLPRIGSVL